ncbi:MAG: hypothetical protein H0V88_14260 [Pyrinomonadaceae bacterium]|nr:hypothetical protein [Pyrinomonadaceae bacterium]
MNKNLSASFLAFALVLSLSVAAVADTIRLKDGTVIRGQVVGFGDQQFTVLIGSGARGRRSRITLYMEDVESIEFDGATNTTAAVPGDSSDTIASGGSTSSSSSSRPVEPRPTTQPSSNPPASSANPSSGNNRSSFFPVNVRVRADSTTNGWTNTGLVVRRGQRLRVSSTGRISLGGGRFSTPAGLPSLPDRDKLMRNEATGALIAVIGDDNDDFIFIGNRREFTAQRDGVLFLGVNEGNLADNTGLYDVTVEAEANSGR